MADYNITISNTMVVLGGSPASVYGTAEFGTDYWGASEDYEIEIHKFIGESLSLSETLTKDATIKINEAVSAAAGLDLVAKTDSDGYIYIEAGASDPDNRNFPSYTADGSTDPGYTSQTASDPSWSES